MKKGLFLILIVIVVLLLAGGVYFYLQNKKTPQPSSNENLATGINHDIEIKNFAFSPAELTIKIGDTVTWKNFDLAAHRVISDTGTELDSLELRTDKSYAHTFYTAGTYDYHCGIHTYMKGKIIVQ